MLIDFGHTPTLGYPCTMQEGSVKTLTDHQDL
jgi:hypothetical protein